MGDCIAPGTELNSKTAFIFPLFGGNQLDDDQNKWPPIPKPSAIDGLIAKKPIGKMTADEYVAVVRQAHLALYEGKRELQRPTRRRDVA
jgi:hypothetical protein